LKILSRFFAWVFAVFAPPKKDLKVVLLCFIGAAVIWLFNALNKKYTTDLRCPVTYEFDKTGLVVVKPPPAKIEINVSAGGWSLLRRNLLFTWYPVKINLQNPVNSHYVIGSSMAPALSDQMPDLTINNVETDSLFYDIQNLKEKTLIGKVSLENIHLENSYRIVGPIILVPAEFKISGPEKLIDTLPDDFQITIDRDGINKPYSDDIRLDYFNTSLVKFMPEKIHVSFDVEKFVSKRIKIPVVPVNFPKDSAAFIPDPWINANFSVQVDLQDSVDTNQFMITADFKNTVRKDSIVPVQIVEISKFAIDFNPDTTYLKVIYAKKRRFR
jgi:hypothetical protein